MSYSKNMPLFLTSLFASVLVHVFFLFNTWDGSSNPFYLKMTEQKSFNQSKLKINLSFFQNNKKALRIVRKKKVISDKLITSQAAILKTSQHAPSKIEMVKSNSFLESVRKYLEENKNYPTRSKVLKENGHVKVKMTFYKNKNASFVIEEETPYPRLNRASRLLIENILTMKIPIDYEKDSLTTQFQLTYQAQ